MQRWKLSYETQNILYDVIERNMKFEQEDREHIQRSDVAVNTCICLYICRAVFYFVSLLSSMLLFMCELNIFIVSSFKCALFSCASGTHVLMLAACMHIYTYSTRSHKHLNTHEHTCTIHKTISDDHALFCHAIYTPPSLHTLTRIHTPLAHRYRPF